MLTLEEYNHKYYLEHREKALESSKATRKRRKEGIMGSRRSHKQKQDHEWAEQRRKEMNRKPYMVLYPESTIPDYFFKTEYDKRVGQFDSDAMVYKKTDGEWQRVETQMELC
jgi:hypothetical protein